MNILILSNTPIDATVIVAGLSLIATLIVSITAIVKLWMKLHANKQHVKLETSLSIYIKDQTLSFKDAINLPESQRFDLYIIRIINKIRQNHTDRKHLTLDFTNVNEFNNRFKEHILLIIEDTRENNDITLVIKIPNNLVFNDLYTSIQAKQMEMDGRNFDKNVNVELIDYTDTLELVEAIKTIASNINFNFRGEDVLVDILIEGELRYRFEQYVSLRLVMLLITSTMFELSARKKIFTIDMSSVTFWDSSSESSFTLFIEETSKYKNVIINVIISDDIVKYDRLKDDIERSITNGIEKDADRHIYIYSSAEYNHMKEEQTLEQMFDGKVIATGTP